MAAAAVDGHAGERPGRAAVRRLERAQQQRLGGFDDAQRSFFATDRKFRQPAYLATSFDVNVANYFISRSAMPEAAINSPAKMKKGTARSA